MEGVICVLMAGAVCVGAGGAGWNAGYTIQAHHWRPKQTPAMMSIVLLLIPASFGIEHAAALRPPTFEVQTAIEVNAPPEKVGTRWWPCGDSAAKGMVISRRGSRIRFRAEISGHGIARCGIAYSRRGRSWSQIEVWDAAAAAEIWRDRESGTVE